MYGMRKMCPSSLHLSPALESAFLKPQPKAVLPWSLYQPGLPLGALTQVEGRGKSSAFLKLCTEHPKLRAAWVEASLSAYPPAFAQAGVDLNLLLFVQGGEHYAWAVTQLLRAQLFPLLALASPIQGDLELRRLQLAAEKSGTAVLLLSEIQGPSWPIKLKLEASLEGESGSLSLRQRLEHFEILKEAL
jgi:hypothetical protein